MVSAIAFVILIAGISTSFFIQALPVDDDTVIITTDATLLWNDRDDKRLNGVVPADVYIHVGPKRVYHLKGYSPVRRPAGCSIYMEANGEFRNGEYNSTSEQLYRKLKFGAEPELAALLPDGQGYVMTYDMLVRITIRPNDQCYSESKKTADVKHVTTTSLPSSSGNLLSRFFGICRKCNN